MKINIQNNISIKQFFFLFLMIILDYNEIIIPSISFNNIFNKIFNLSNPIEETKLPSQQNILSNEMTNIFK